MSNDPTAKADEAKLDPQRFHLEEQVAYRYRVYPEQGATRERLLRPEYWAHIARKVSPGTLINALAEDGTYYAELIVLACDRAWAKVHLLSWHDLTTQDVSRTQAEKPDYIWAYKGIHKKHCIIRTADEMIVHEGAGTKDQALDWLKEHMKTMAR